MQLIRTDTQEAILLPYDLFNNEEFNWQAVAKQMDYAIDGSLIVQEAIKKGGRKVVLKAPADMAWITRQTLAQLYEWANTLGLIVEWSGARFMFDNDAIKAQPIKEFKSDNDNDLFSVQINLIEI